MPVAPPPRLSAAAAAAAGSMFTVVDDAGGCGWYCYTDICVTCQGRGRGRVSKLHCPSQVCVNLPRLQSRLQSLSQS